MVAMRLKVALAFVLLSVLHGGCMNLSSHRDGSGVRIYGGTRDDAKVIAIPFRKANNAEESIEKAYATILLPLSIIDLPFEIVADTLTLPYDVFQ